LSNKAKIRWLVEPIVQVDFLKGGGLFKTEAQAHKKINDLAIEAGLCEDNEEDQIMRYNLVKSSYKVSKVRVYDY